VELGGGRSCEDRKEAGSIISPEKNAERDHYMQPANPDLHEATWMNTAFCGLGYVYYG